MRRFWRSCCLAAWLAVAGFPVAAQPFESAPSSASAYGAHVAPDGWVEFGFYAPDAAAVNLLLFDGAQALTPTRVVPMQRVGEDWRIRIRGTEARPGLHYMYEADGPRALSPARHWGAMFNRVYPLGDPYAARTTGVSYGRVFAATPFVDATTPVYAGGGKSIVYDHARDAAPGHLRIAPQDLVVYELHVQDYTARIETLDPALRGTYLGLARSGLTTPGGLAAGLDHLVELGVNAVELMPVMEYDEETGNAEGRLNHWGYMTANFFAPETRYASRPGAEIVELKELVRALHARGIAVFLDVVYNHTAEGKPWLDNDRLAAKCFNLLCAALAQVYRPTPDGRFFLEHTGAGNDVDFTGADGRFTKRLVADSLAFWHQVYGIDGFRFDLARILADGSASAADWIDNDPRFAAAHLHAEPWDLAGQWWDFMDNYGWSSGNNRWAKWLGKYRDQSRRFSASALRDARALKRLVEGYGSVADGFGPPASSKPWRSINFTAVHDGYTLRDCVFYNDADGSQNCWDSGGDENLRRERQKLLLGLLLTSQGVPLILQGDEFGQTKSGAGSQEGARNSYNYESTRGDAAVNNVNWIDWRLKDADTSASPNAPAYGGELFDWTRGLVALRKTWSHFRRADFPDYVTATDDRAGRRNDGRFTYVWEGPGPGAPSQLAVVWWGAAGEPDLMVVYNEDWAPFRITNLGAWSRGDWKVLARSWLGRDAHLCAPARWQTCPDAGDAIEVKGRSMAILVSGND